MKHVLLISRALIPSVSLCGHSQLTLLEKKGRIGYRWLPPWRVQRRDFLWADILVFVRADDDISLFLAKAARRAGKSAWYVLDDDLLNIPEGLDSSAHYGREETRELLRQNMASCSVLLSPSRNLLAKYGGGFEKCVRIEEPAARRLLTKEEHPGAVRIGFAGSIDRTEDINVLLSGALRRVKERYGERISVEFFGARPGLVDELGLRHIPYEDSYESYVNTMCELNWDIGLAPLPDTAFHSCKHYNKFIEYASYGIAGVYSALEPYVWAVRDGENGLLCENTEEAWYGAVTRLIEDAALRKRISAECLREAGEVYSLEKTAEAWEALIEETPAAPSRFCAMPGYDIARIGQSLRWAVRKLLAWGWRAPIKIAEKIGKRLSRT